MTKYRMGPVFWNTDLHCFRWVKLLLLLWKLHSLF